MTEPTTEGRVPAEGQQTRPPAKDADEQMRDFVARLFGRPVSDERTAP